MKLLPLVLVLCLALFACGGEDEPSEPAATSTPTAEATAAAPTAAPAEATGQDSDAEAEVREMFTDYTKALAARDWDEACEHLAPETTDKLKANVAQLGLTDAPDDCEGLMEGLYLNADPEMQSMMRMYEFFDIDGIAILDMFDNSQPRHQTGPLTPPPTSRTG